MDDIFRMMNNTNSSAGQEYSYRMLRQPDADMESLKKLDRLATAIDKNASKRLELPKIFVWIGRASRLYLLVIIVMLLGWGLIKKQCTSLCFIVIFSCSNSFYVCYKSCYRIWLYCSSRFFNNNIL